MTDKSTMKAPFSSAEISAMAREAGLTDPSLGEWMIDYGNAKEEIKKFVAIVANRAAGIDGLKSAVAQPVAEILEACRAAANSRCGDAILNAKDLIAYILVQKACLDGEREAMKMVRDSLCLPRGATVFDVVHEIQRLQQRDKLKPSDLPA